VGGNWNNGSNDGRFALNLNNAPSNTNNNIGFRCALPEVEPASRIMRAAGAKPDSRKPSASVPRSSHRRVVKSWALAKTKAE
jgi:hypothetical protein